MSALVRKPISKVLMVYIGAMLIWSLAATAEETKTAATATPAPSATAVTTEKTTKVEKKKETPAKADKKAKKGSKKMFALMETTKGKIKIALFNEKVPNTVDNFVGLAEGTKEWTDPKTNKKVKKAFYDGLTFHRVIPKFMIQGGCPLGTGTGGPGYRFEDEFKSDLKHNKPYLLSMANAGPNTNGSQFFITVAATPWLDNHHTIFGEVVEGSDVVDQIVGVDRDSGDRPKTPIVMTKVTIVRE